MDSHQAWNAADAADYPDSRVPFYYYGQVGPPSPQWVSTADFPQSGSPSSSLRGSF